MKIRIKTNASSLVFHYLQQDAQEFFLDFVNVVGYTVGYILMSIFYRPIFVHISVRFTEHKHSDIAPDYCWEITRLIVSIVDKVY